MKNEELGGAFLSVQSNKCLLATCNLNQWALDFDGNLNRIMTSIRVAKQQGAKYRLGPELEISGYSCEDHFFEIDTFMHCDQSLAAILASDVTNDILCDIGCPILHNNVRYNCRALCLNGKIVHIRPKIYLADDGNYRERRHFTGWDSTDHKLHEHVLSDLLRSVTKQTTVPIGLAVITTMETTIACEICEELWTADSPHIDMFLSGVEIIANASGSHHTLRKLNNRLDLMRNATMKCGGVYVYSNHRGCDGNRLYFDGSSLICVNGEIVTQASQFSLNDVEVVTAVVDLENIRSHRGLAGSFQEQSSKARSFNSIDLRHFSLRPWKSTANLSQIPPESKPVPPRIHSPQEECCLGPACWLWDYLRRSGAAGFLLPLSGGADSSSVAAIVRVMSVLVAREVLIHGNSQVIQDVTKIFKTCQSKTGLLTLSSLSAPDKLTTDKLKMSDEENVQTLANDLCYHILHTVYMGTQNSSESTKNRALKLGNSIHSYHSSISIDGVVKSLITLFTSFSGKSPRYKSQGGTMTEDLALQNIQARLRMVVAYLFAQLFPWLRGSNGFLLVLGSANVDEALRGYMTKYDCSSADINPIGGMSKGDLKTMLAYIAENYNLPVLIDVANAAPTAELRPFEAKESEESTQTDEEDMGMTYKELGVFGHLRKILQCGPVKMFLKLTDMWKHLKPVEIAEKVKRFFFYYSVNRHKLTTLTPSYHAENYSPDDNRYDLRPFLYNTKWNRQFNTIDSIVNSSFQEETQLSSPHVEVQVPEPPVPPFSNGVEVEGKKN